MEQQQPQQLQYHQQFQTTPQLTTFMTNHPKIKKRKGLDTVSNSPLAKIRSATLTRHATSKLQFVVDLGSSLGGGNKTPSKSTANSMSLHSSVPSHMNSPSQLGQSGASSILGGSVGGNDSVCNSPSIQQIQQQQQQQRPTSHKKKKSNTNNNTLNRRSVRISQQLKLDEVMKIYAPLSGSDYLSSPKVDSPVVNKKFNAISTPNSKLDYSVDYSNNTPILNSSKKESNGNGSTSISPLLQSLSVKKSQQQQQDDNKENIINSPPTSPPLSPLSLPSNNNAQQKGNMSRTMSPIRLSLTLSPSRSRKSLSLKDQHTINSRLSLNAIQPLIQPTSTTNTNSTNNNNTTQYDHELTSIKREVMESSEYILARMGEYQRIVLSLPDLFMLSRDILHSEYEYLIKDTKTISRILSPLDCMDGSDTDTNVITTNQSPVLKSANNLRSSNGKHQPPAHEPISEMDIIARSIASIAKKVLSIEIEMKKVGLTEKKALTLYLFVQAVKEYLESGTLPSELPKVPSDVAHSLISSSGVNSTTALYKPEENADHKYKSGYLIKKANKGPLIVWKDQWFVLSSEKLSIYSNHNKTKSKKEILLNNILSIAPCTKYDYKHCFMLVSKNPDYKIVVRATSDKEAAMWMLAIDGLPRRNFDTNQSAINQYIRENMLEVIGSTGGVLNYRRSTAGGIIRSSHGESWTYRADGLLYNTDHLEDIRPKELRYIWNGLVFVASEDSKRNLGSGKWNGVWLAWYHTNNEPFLKYMWEPESNEYLNQNHRLSYKWSTRGGLVSKIGLGGEWMVEGSVPATVVMFLQCLRYCRLGMDY